MPGGVPPIEPIDSMAPKVDFVPQTRNMGGAFFAHPSERFRSCPQKQAQTALCTCQRAIAGHADSNRLSGQYAGLLHRQGTSPSLKLSMHLALYPIERLMKRLGVYRGPRGKVVRNRRSAEVAPSPAEQVNREFQLDSPNRYECSPASPASRISKKSHL